MPVGRVVGQPLIVGAPPDDPDGDHTSMRATRSLLRVTSRAEAVRVLHDAVARLAGEVVPAGQTGSGDPNLLPIDVSLGVGVPVQVRALVPDDTRLARCLPQLVEDATLVAARADEAALLGRRATMDPLTGVASKGQITERLDAARPGDVICVLDLDKFKQLNDTLGHLAGDAALRRFGNHLRKKIRQGDFVARSGGDEFLLILEGVEIPLAHLRMTELAKSWAEDESMTSTVSIGVAAVTGSGSMAAAGAADRAMYRAKRGGMVAVEMARAAEDRPSSRATLNDTYDAYLACLAIADAPAAVAVLGDAIARGLPKKDLIRSVIARGQSTVGMGWAAGEWSVAEEHAATAVADQALTLIAPPPSTPPSTTATRVIIACAEGEWHTMPARLAAELARSPELDIVVLGGSIPAAQLAADLRSSVPSVLALSVTVPTNLIGAHRCIQAARAQGIRVIVGGAAWGSTQLRAQNLGASLMLEDVRELARHVSAGDVRAEATGPTSLPAEALLLERPSPELIQDAFDLWTAGRDAERIAAERGDALEMLGWIARHAAAAVACDDSTVVGDLLRSQLTSAKWLGHDFEPILGRYQAVATAVTSTAPRAAAILRGEVLRLTV